MVVDRRLPDELLGAVLAATLQAGGISASATPAPRASAAT
jgi:hypothetical protein